MEDKQFEWDEKKEEQNIKRHGISFEIASLVFADENYIDIYDKKTFHKRRRKMECNRKSRRYFVCSLHNKKR